MWVIQLAKLAGAEIIGTTGPDNAEIVKGLGAKDVIDYRITSLQEWSQKLENQVDIVINCSDRKSLEDAWWIVEDGGVLISILHPSELVRPYGCSEKTVRNCFFVMQPSRTQLEQITTLIDDGNYHSLVDSVWRFEDYKKAYERADSGRAVRMVVLDLVAAA